MSCTALHTPPPQNARPPSADACKFLAAAMVLRKLGQRMRATVEEEAAYFEDESAGLDEGEGDKVVDGADGDSDENKGSDFEEDGGGEAAVDMGFKIEPFHMREEREEGYTIKHDKEDGHSYVEGAIKISRGDRDEWLEEYDEVWEKRVRLGKGAAAREPDKVQPKKVARVELPPMPPAEAKKFLIEVLHRGETARDGMRRLKTSGGGSQSAFDLERVIEACDVLLRAGIADVYSRNREEIMGAGSSATGSTADEEPGWEYHVGSMGSPLQGPFSHSQMVEWFKQGFFNSTEMFLRRSGDRLFVSSRSTDLSSFFE